MNDKPLAPRLDEVLRSLVSGYIQFADDLDVKFEIIGHTLQFSVRVHEDDYGKVIGGGGKNIKALQTIFGLIGENKGFRIDVCLLESVKGRKMEITPFVENANWKPDGVIKILSDLLDFIFIQPSTIEAKAARKSVLTYIEISNPDFATICPELKDAIHTIFHAVGKSQGRQIRAIFINPSAAVIE